MSERISIVPDDSGGKEVKLNFRSLWSFFSSLDYLRFLELEGAFRTLRSENLYYVEEKTELMNFVLRHVVLWINLGYLLIIISGYFFFREKFLVMHLAFSLLYFAGGIWFVHRYAIGRGYLYMVVRDFLLWLTAFVFLGWVITEFATFWLIPKLWQMFEAWLFDPYSREGSINEILYPTALNIYNMIKPHLYDLFGTKKFLVWYFALAPVKVFALTFPYPYFLIYSRFRKSPAHLLDRELKRRA